MNMSRDEAIRLLQSGGVDEWNRQRDPNDWLPNLAEAQLADSWLARGNFAGAGFRDADFSRAQLGCADLREADLREATLFEAQLFGTNLSWSDLRGADLRRCALDLANLNGAKVAGADFSGARVQATSFGAIDLSEARGLEIIHFFGTCIIDRATFAASCGRIAPSFLVGCGLEPWELPLVRAYTAEATVQQLSADFEEAHRLRAGLGGGVFLSYSHEDSRLADKLYEALRHNSYSVWLDRRDSTAGSVERQIRERIARSRAVVVILSRHSVSSAWVEFELRLALERERGEGNDVLCPISVDNSWQAATAEPWSALGSKVILDFAQWGDDEAFASTYERLVRGLASHYANPTEPGAWKGGRLHEDVP